MSNAIGLYSALPATPVGHTDGDRYFCTDCPYYFIANSGEWDAYYNGNPVIIPPTGMNTDNPSPITIDQSHGYIHVSCVGSGGTNLSALYLAAPAGAYKITMGFFFNPISEGSYSNSDCELGLGFRSASVPGDYSILAYGITTFELSPPNARGVMSIEGWSNNSTPTFTGSQLFDPALFTDFVGVPFYLEIEDDGVSISTQRFGIDKNNLYVYNSGSYSTRATEWAVTFRPGRGIDVTIFDLNGASIALAVFCASGTGTVSIPYSSSLSAVGGSPPYTYAITVGTLPTGLSLDSSTGAITGTPTLAGVYPYTAQVTDSLSATATIGCSITIADLTPLTLACASNVGTLTIPYDSFLVAAGGIAPYTFSLFSGTLPPGLNLNTSTGEITGTPTMTGTYPFSPQVADSDGHVTPSSCQIIVSNYPPQPPLPPSPANKCNPNGGLLFTGMGGLS